jgi:hypothetical protein
MQRSVPRKRIVAGCNRQRADKGAAFSRQRSKPADSSHINDLLNNAAFAPIRKSLFLAIFSRPEFETSGCGDFARRLKAGLRQETGRVML